MLRACAPTHRCWARTRTVLTATLDSLPRGSGIVTRRPLVLQLINRAAQSNGVKSEEVKTSDAESNADEWGGSELEPADIEFPETRAYVEGVLDKKVEYREEYGQELGYR